MTASKEEILANPVDNWDAIMADPQLFEQFKQQSGQIKSGEQPKPWDILNPNAPKVNEDESNRRYAICLECPELLKITKQCKLCGCFMRVKTKLQDAYCPDGKW